MSPKLKRQADQLAQLIVEIAAGDRTEIITGDGKNAAAVLLGRRGGLKGGRARAEKLTARRRTEIASAAAAARWKRK